MAGEDALDGALPKLTHALRTERALEDVPHPRLGHIPNAEQWGNATPNHLPQAVGEPSEVSAQLLVMATLLPQLCPLGTVEAYGPKRMPVGAKRTGKHVGVAPVVLRPPPL